MRRRELEGKRGGSEQKGRDDGRSEAGGVEDKTASSHQVCAEVQEVLRGEVGESNRKR